jgi:hypothetical protein
VPFLHRVKNTVVKGQGKDCCTSKAGEDGRRGSGVGRNRNATTA